MDFLAILACESLYHSQGGATPVTPHMPMADVCYGTDGPSPNDMRLAIFETITTELEVL